VPQYIVLIMPPGTQIPPEGQAAHANFVLTTQADANAAAVAAEAVLKPGAGDRLFTTQTSNLQQNVVTITYGVA